MYVWHVFSCLSLFEKVGLFVSFDTDGSGTIDKYEAKKLLHFINVDVRIVWSSMQYKYSNMHSYIYIYTCIWTYMYTYIIYLHPCIHILHTYHTYLHTYIHTYSTYGINTLILSYIHAYNTYINLYIYTNISIHTYIHTLYSSPIFPGHGGEGRGADRSDWRGRQRHNQLRWVLQVHCAAQAGRC